MDSDISLRIISREPWHSYACLHHLIITWKVLGVHGHISVITQSLHTLSYCSNTVTAFYCVPLFSDFSDYEPW